MELIQDAKEVLKKNKFSSFFALGGLLVAAALDAHLLPSTSAFTVFTSLVFQTIAGQAVAGAISHGIFKNKDNPESEKEVLNDLKKTLPVTALIALSSYFANDLIQAGMPVANTAKELIKIGGFGSAYFTVASTGVLTYKKVKEHLDSKKITM